MVSKRKWKWTCNLLVIALSLALIRVFFILKRSHSTNNTYRQVYIDYTLSVPLWFHILLIHQFCKLPAGGKMLI